VGGSDILWFLRRVFLLAALAVAAVLGLPASAAAQTVVSLTFDDGWDNNYTVRSIFAERGMNATFYVNSNTIGSDGYLSWAQVGALNADGHEIAGHTLDHPNLTAVTSEEARRQICDDRADLLNRGFIVPSFAYPFGEYDSTVKTIVRDCGYASGRGAFGLRNLTATNDTRPYAEKIPPVDRYAILTPCCIGSDTPLETLQNYITQAENNGGGWVPLVLHQICDNCGDTPAPSMKPTTLAALLDWLQPRASRGTIVRTVNQVISGDSQPPTSSISCNSTTCTAGSYANSVTVGLASTDAGSGVSKIRYTVDGSEPTVSSPTYSGPFTVATTTTVRYRAWDNAGSVEAARSQLIRIDVESPTVAITSPTAGATVKGVVKVTAAASDAGSGIARVSFYANGTLIGTKASAPYTVSWNTNKLTKGQYTLTAVAADVAGNTHTSSPVTVTVG
jgi:peptidoglycan/xylan/chitin deacetylase (PgdA/CDA1 family)